jgi:hypothetical protein
MASLRIPAPFGAERRRFLLRLADKHHTFLLAEFAQMLGHHLVLALPFAELHERYLVLRHEAFQLRHKAPAHWVHQGCGRQELAAARAHRR